MSRQYYKTSQDIYKLFLNHPVMSQLLDEFGIDESYDPSDLSMTIRLEDVCEYLVEHDDDLTNNSLSMYYNDSSIVEDISELYGFAIDVEHPISSYASNRGTPLAQLLNYTLYFYKFAVTDNFYEKHFLDFVPEYDREEILSNEKLKLTIESIGRKLDDVEDKISRLKNVYDFDETPEELLDYLGQTLGYEREDDSLSSFSFRELLKNIIEIYKIKGTGYSFSFFFKFLGFEVGLKEFYFNRYSENAEAFPGVDKTKVEYFLTIKNPIFDTENNKPANHLAQTRNLDDWEIEYNGLINAGCINISEYMRGIESYNNDTVTFHSNPWTYFKTNLIEYELNPFFERLNLTASDNETIKKYVAFLSPTYLFTWININLRPWIEDIHIVSDPDTDWLINIIKTLGDPRPTPHDPWPAHPQGQMGVPENLSSIYNKKTASDDGFEPPYLDYENVSDYIALWDADGDKLSFKLTNKMNLGGDDVFGSSLIRNRTHIRQPGHPRHITDAKHDGAKRLAFDQLGSAIKAEGALDIPENWIDYSIKSYPAVPIEHRPLGGRTITSSNIVNFNWEDSSGQIAYWIQLANNINFSNLIYDYDDINNSEYNSASTLHNDRYYWRIRVKNNTSHPVPPLEGEPPLGMWTAWSSTWSFTLKTIPFPFNSESINSDTLYVDSLYRWIQETGQSLFINVTFDLEWQKILGSRNYQVEVAFDSLFNSKVYDEIILYNKLTVVLENSTYYWRYKAKDRNTGLWGDWSSTLTFDINFPTTI